MNKIKTVGIIGGGVSGLAAAGLLTRQGLNVVLLEANSKLGGSCATTNLDGYIFNDGALYLAMPGVLDHVFERIGLNRPSLLPLRKITKPQMTQLPDGSLVTFGDDLDVTVERDGKVVNKAITQKELTVMMQKWGPVLDFFMQIVRYPFSLTRFIASGWRHLPKLRGTVASELNRLFSDEAVRAAMSGALLFNGIPPQQMPMLSLMGLIALFSEDFYLPEGGMGAIPEAMSRSLKPNGVAIHLNSRVKRIVVQDGRISGMEVSGLGFIEADAVISTVSGMLTFNSLLEPEDVPVSMKKKVRKTPLSHRAFVVQLGLLNKVDLPSHAHYVLPKMEDQYKVFASSKSEMEWLIYSVPTVTMPELAPDVGSIIEMYPTISQDIPLEAWDDEMKTTVYERAVQSLSQVHKLDIVVKRLISPKDFQTDLHLYNGSIYGLSPAADPRAQFFHKTPIRGLYQAGQTTYPGFGVGFAALSGILAAEVLMKNELK